jgi:hypothetical protein
MLKRVFFVFLSLLVFSRVYGNNKAERVLDLQGNRQIDFKTLQQSLAKTAYNKFERIYIDYPVLEAKNPGVAVKAINDFMYKKAFLDMETDAFKFEFLPFAYGALASTLGKNYPDNYAYYSANMGIPTIQEVAPKILFVSGDILCYQVLFEFYFEPQSNYKLDGYSFVKTYYLQLSTGKEISLLNLFEPTQRKGLQDLLSKELNQILQSNKQYVSSFNWDQGNELGMYANDEDEYLVEEEETGETSETQSASSKDKTKMPEFGSQDLNHVFLNLNPFSAQFILPPFYSSFEAGKQLGVLITIPLESLAKLLLKPSLLGNWFSNKKQATKVLQHINVLQKQHGNYTQLVNPSDYNSSFTTKVAVGTKTQSLFVLEQGITDTQYSLQRTAHYDKSGRLIKLVFGSGKQADNWLYFEYDSIGNLLNEINYAYNQIEAQKTYVYNAQNCLWQVISSANTDLPSVTQYFYRDSFVYESRLVQLFTSMDNFKEGNVMVYALDAYNNIKSSYGLNQTPNYISKYHQDNIMASFSVQYPNLDNVIYAYDKEGNLETIIGDNGRRLHTFTHKNKRLQSYTHYDTYVIQNQYSYQYDDKNNLIKYVERGQYGNKDRMYILKYTCYE